MKRRGKDINPRVRPVTRIDLDDRPDKNKKRIILAAVLLTVGLGFIGYAVWGFLSPGTDSGWVEVEPVAESAESVAQEMVFLYELGVSGQSASSEYKALSQRYTELCMDAYRIFTADVAYDGVHNLLYVHEHIGEDVTVEPELYRAFEQIEAAGSRFLFAAPFFREYQNLFGSTEDAVASQFDPWKSDEIAVYFDELAAYTASEEHIRLDLLGDGRVRLTVSDAYRAFAAENGIEIFADLWWARNAFCVDFLCEKLTEEGYTYGSISSYDGFSRVMDQRDTAYSYNVYGVQNNALYGAVCLQYVGPRATVSLRTYPMTDQDDRYYIYGDGTRRHPYVDVTDGRCKNALDGLVAYGDGKGCAEVLLAAMPVFITNTFEATALDAPAAAGIYAVYIVDGVTHCTDPAVDLSATSAPTT